MRAVLAAAALAVALPANALGATGYNTTSPDFVTLDPAIKAAGGEIVALVNSGEVIFGDTFQGIPDGIGVVPGRKHDDDDRDDDRHADKNKRRWVDLYVTHEESTVPFGTTPTNQFADFQDSSVTRVRVDTDSMSVIDMEVVLPASAGFIRFCSAFMAGPQQGFPHYTFMVNEESNDDLPVPPGAVYGPDANIPAHPTDPTIPVREAGYSVWFDTVTGKYDVVPGLGRQNHENTVIVPAWRNMIAAFSGDDTFTAPSSQLYLYTARNWRAFEKDQGKLWAFRVTATHAGPLGHPEDPQNNANDFLEISPGQAWKGEFIEVDPDIARGTRPGVQPQAGLEQWSNDHNVFQFVRVEDIAYDPDNPRVIYFTDTGTTRLKEGADGRLFRAGSTTFPHVDSDGRIFKMVLNKWNPRIVDSFSILAQGGLREQTGLDMSTIPPTQIFNVIDPGVGFVNPDNLDVGHQSIMLQEDRAAGSRIWMNRLGNASWTPVGSVVDPPGTWPTPVNQGESSGVVDVSEWFGKGWWVLDVQSHRNRTETPATAKFDWTGPPGPAVGTDYQKRLEHGQLLLMYIPGS